MKARLIRTCTGPRPLDGVGGRLRRLRWCGHFIAATRNLPVWRIDTAASAAQRKAPQGSGAQ
jgi:hypothetical protein